MSSRNKKDKDKNKKNKRLTLLSEIERNALYQLPDFNETQRSEYLLLTEAEQKLAFSQGSLSSQLYCALQIGYFKTKHIFFNFSWDEIPEEDIHFLRFHYFENKSFSLIKLTPYEQFTQRKQISALLGYQLWLDKEKDKALSYAANAAKRNINPSYILMNLLQFFKERKLIRPKYTTLQDIISKAINIERNRLNQLIRRAMIPEVSALLNQLLVRENILSELAVLKQDAKNFNYTMLIAERKKLEMIRPIYQLAKSLIPRFNISQQNLYYYASLIHYYSIAKLKRFKPQHQAHLYLLCYLWQRYQQFVDNLVSAFSYHQKKYDDESKILSKEQFNKYSEMRQKKLIFVGQLLKFYVDDEIADELQFGDIRKQAFLILPKEQIKLTINQIEKPETSLSFRWKEIDKLESRVRRYLRPLFLTLDISCNIPNYKWMLAIQQLKKYFLKPSVLAEKETIDIFLDTIPKSLRPYLLTVTDDEIPCINMKRYEFWLYRRLKKLFTTGQIYLDDSFNYRCFDNELVALNKIEDLKKQLNLPIFKKPVKKELKEISEEVKELWIEFNQKLKDGKLSSLEYDNKTKEILWHKPKSNKEEEKEKDLAFQFYSRLPRYDIIDVLRFVNKNSNFLSALTPVQPYYAKNKPDEDGLIATVLAQALNHGNQKMSEISDLSYDALYHLKRQHLRAGSLRDSNDAISDKTKELEIFPSFSLDIALIVGSVDGQKYSVARPTIKARESSKYFGRGKGVVAYTLLANNIPLQSMIIGAHEHESYYMLDILSHNTTSITPSIITGDMHSKNKANFFALHCFDYEYYLRFSNIKNELKHLYCCDDLCNYKDCLVKPVDKIDLDLIEEQWSPYIEMVIVTLAQKETTQNIIMRKLCHHQQNRTLKAIYEYDKLISTRYILKCLLDPKLQQLANHSQNCIESYHQLRAAVAQTRGKKELVGRNDIDIEISNQAGRLVANAVIQFNSIILSVLRNKYKREGRLDLVEKIEKISPIGWQHIHFLGHYVFRGNKHPIDLEALINASNLFDEPSAA